MEGKLPNGRPKTRLRNQIRKDIEVGGEKEKIKVKRKSILLNIIFHAPMGIFQLELIYCFTFIFHRRPN